MKRKLEKPEVKIVKLQSMDVIATSGDTPFDAPKIGAKNLNYKPKEDWMESTTPLNNGLY